MLRSELRSQFPQQIFAGASPFLGGRLLEAGVILILQLSDEVFQRAKAYRPTSEGPDGYEAGVEEPLEPTTSSVCTLKWFYVDQRHKAKSMEAIQD
eukprot:Skav226451  [mRNA]  locus=scaffold3855:158918:165761:+ [translate_table: standard]